MSDKPGPGWRRQLWRLVRLSLVCYLGVVLVLLLLENSLVYPASGPGEWALPPSPDIQDVDLTSADGTKIHAWWCPCPGADSALLYCHGNAGNLSHRGYSILKIRELLKVHVLIFDYPGYGKSDGRPTEKGCYQSADAAYDWLVKTQKIDPGRIILYGGSLGGGIAVDVASRKTHRALVLLKTFTSCPAVAAKLYPWLPVRWIMRNRFDSIGKIGLCTQPVFIGHGTKDKLIPFSEGQRLFDAANEPKQFFTLAGSDHNDGLPATLFEALRDFLAKNDPPSD